MSLLESSAYHHFFSTWSRWAHVCWHKACLRIRACCVFIAAEQTLLGKVDISKMLVYKWMKFISTISNCFGFHFRKMSKFKIFPKGLFDDVSLPACQLVSPDLVTALKKKKSSSCLSFSTARLLGFPGFQQDVTGYICTLQERRCMEYNHMGYLPLVYATTVEMSSRKASVRSEIQNEKINKMLDLRK